MNLGPREVVLPMVKSRSQGLIGSEAFRSFPANEPLRKLYRKPMTRDHGIAPGPGPGRENGTIQKRC